MKRELNELIDLLKQNKEENDQGKKSGHMLMVEALQEQHDKDKMKRDKELMKFLKVDSLDHLSPFDIGRAKVALKEAKVDKGRAELAQGMADLIEDKKKARNWLNEEIE